jgi:hypothetical protein
VARKKPRADHRADNRGGPWAGIPHAVLKSEAYSKLSLWARAVLIEIVLQMNGYNNGKIAVSQRQLAARLNRSNFKKLSEATAELMQHGFIDIVIEGQWKQQKAREFRLTFVNTGTNGRYIPAPNDYLHWRPSARNRAEPPAAETPRSAHAASAGRRIAAANGSTPTLGKPPFLIARAAEHASALINKPCGGCSKTQGNKGEKNGWPRRGLERLPAARSTAAPLTEQEDVPP